jgi:hypothetical protein
MELIPWPEIEELPHTARYLREHEEMLRRRERGKMDTSKWYAFSRTQSLERLRACTDPDGVVYLDNVDVNGIIPNDEGPSLGVLSVLLNSRLLDFLFRLQTVPFRGDYLSANKQFIAPLPIKVPDEHEADLERLGRAVHEIAVQLGTEQKSFLDWLSDQIGANPRSLPGKTRLAAYDENSAGDLIALLRRSARSLTIDPSTRAFRDRFTKEHAGSVEALLEQKGKLGRAEAEVDRLVYEIYGITRTDREFVEEAYA